MNVIVTVITSSRRDVGFAMCSYQYPRIKLGSAVIQITIRFFMLPEAC